jgi:hypothetical protein
MRSPDQKVTILSSRDVISTPRSTFTISSQDTLSIQVPSCSPSSFHICQCESLPEPAPRLTRSKRSTTRRYPMRAAPFNGVKRPIVLEPLLMPWSSATSPSPVADRDARAQLNPSTFVPLASNATIIFAYSPTHIFFGRAVGK